MPSARASAALMRATVSAAAGSQLAASASGTGKHGAMAVNHILPEEDGNVQARLLDRDVLVVIRGFGAHHVEHGADLPRSALPSHSSVEPAGPVGLLA